MKVFRVSESSHPYPAEVDDFIMFKEKDLTAAINEDLSKGAVCLPFVEKKEEFYVFSLNPVTPIAEDMILELDSEFYGKCLSLMNAKRGASSQEAQVNASPEQETKSPMVISEEKERKTSASPRTLLYCINAETQVFLSDRNSFMLKPEQLSICKEPVDSENRTIYLPYLRQHQEEGEKFLVFRSSPMERTSENKCLLLLGVEDYEMILASVNQHYLLQKEEEEIEKQQGSKGNKKDKELAKKLTTQEPAKQQTITSPKEQANTSPKLVRQSPLVISEENEPKASATPRTIYKINANSVFTSDPNSFKVKPEDLLICEASLDSQGIYLPLLRQEGDEEKMLVFSLSPVEPASGNQTLLRLSAQEYEIIRAHVSQHYLLHEKEEIGKQQGSKKKKGKKKDKKLAKKLTTQEPENQVTSSIMEELEPDIIPEPKASTSHISDEIEVMPSATEITTVPVEEQIGEQENEGWVFVQGGKKYDWSEVPAILMRMEKTIKRIGQKIDLLDQKFDGLNQKIDNIDQKLGQNFDGLIQKIRSLVDDKRYMYEASCHSDVRELMRKVNLEEVGIACKTRFEVSFDEPECNRFMQTVNKLLPMNVDSNLSEYSRESESLLLIPSKITPFTAGVCIKVNGSDGIDTSLSFTDSAWPNKPFSGIFVAECFRFFHLECFRKLWDTSSLSQDDGHVKFMAKSFNSRFM